jgi:hypothetical protein
MWTPYSGEVIIGLSCGNSKFPLGCGTPPGCKVNLWALIRRSRRGSTLRILSGNPVGLRDKNRPPAGTPSGFAPAATRFGSFDYKRVFILEPSPVSRPSCLNPNGFTEGSQGSSFGRPLDHRRKQIMHPGGRARIPPNHADHTRIGRVGTGAGTPSGCIPICDVVRRSPRRRRSGYYLATLSGCGTKSPIIWRPSRVAGRNRPPAEEPRVF